MSFLKKFRSIFFKFKYFLAGDIDKILAKAGPLLPIGVYSVDKDGHFLYCNDQFRSILGIKKDVDIRKRSMKEFFFHPAERDELIVKLHHQNGILLNQIIKFKKDNSRMPIFVEDDCIRHEIPGQPGQYFYVGSLNDVTDIVRYRELFNDIFSGVFRINHEDKLHIVNEAVAKIFGYADSAAMIGLCEKKLWKKNKDYEVYLRKLKETGELINYQAEMTKKDESLLHVAINAKLWVNEKDEIIGREGTYTDITKETRYSRALEQLSNGYYEVIIRNGKHIIVNCNNVFAKLHGYGHVNEVIGLDISNFLYNEENKMKLSAEFEKAAAEKRTSIQNLELQVLRKDRSTIWIQLDINLKFNDAGVLIAREGVVRDITERIKLENQLKAKQNELDKLFKDMDKFVHQYISPIMNIDSTAQTLMELLEKRLSKKVDLVKHIDISDQHTDKLITFLEEFITKASPSIKSEHLMKALEENTYKLVHRKTLQKDVIMRELWTRILIFDIMEIVNNLLNKFQSRQHTESYLLLQLINDTIQEICDICILKLHKKILTNTEITHKVIEALRTYLFSDREAPFDFTKMNIMKIIRNNIEIYYYSAKNKGLTIIPPKENYILMEISENHMDRMFSNLILNAIKYSYQRKGGFIRIETEERKNDLEIRIINYGVPIMQDELNKVFEFGYRGKLSHDWNRTGSGIGLADAKNTINKHKGDILISSKPAPPDAAADDYTVPYLTTVTVILPKRRETQ